MWNRLQDRKDVIVVATGRKEGKRLNPVQVNFYLASPSLVKGPRRRSKLPRGGLPGARGCLRRLLDTPLGTPTSSTFSSSMSICWSKRRRQNSSGFRTSQPYHFPGDDNHMEGPEWVTYPDESDDDFDVEELILDEIATSSNRFKHCRLYFI